MPRHKCPKNGCEREIDNRIFACNSDWWALSRTTRDAIHATKNLSPLEPERREAFRMAREDWGDKPV
jgi:hypothetical protein